MSAKGSFDIPYYKHQSTKGARVAYSNMYGREWPHDDDYLRTLALRIDKEYLPQNSVGWTECEMMLNAMRENHEFETSSNR